MTSPSWISRGWEAFYYLCWWRQKSVGVTAPRVPGWPSSPTTAKQITWSSDHKGRPALLQEVRGLALAGSSSSRNLGDSMRFVVRHVFKRVRAGRLLRKVAVFFQVGWIQDAGSISTATPELSALDITSAVITFTEDRNLPDALLVSGGPRLRQVLGVSAWFLLLHQGAHEEWELVRGRILQKLKYMHGRGQVRGWGDVSLQTLLPVLLLVPPGHPWASVPWAF